MEMLEAIFLQEKRGHAQLINKIRKTDQGRKIEIIQRENNKMYN